jgi:uncharacterized protein
MLIELSKLEDGRGKIDHVYAQSELELGDERVDLAEEVTASVKIRRKGSQVAVDGTVETVVEVECDRCLKPVRLPLKAVFSLEYLNKGEYEASEVAELTEQEMDVSVFEGDKIDLDEIVREQILLFVPARALCVENCRGICSTCGADLNAGDCGCVSTETDPRWAALRNFKISE